MNNANVNLDNLFQKAESLETRRSFADAIAVYREILTNDLPVAAKLKAYDGLIRTLTSTRDLDGAEKAGLELYEFLKATFGPDHKNVGLALNRLIQTANAKNDAAKAIDLGKQAVEVFKKVADSAPEERKAAARHQLATVYFTLANNYFDSEDYSNAQAALNSALELWLEVEGPKGQNVATMYNNLGRVFEIQGHREEGIAFHQKCVDIRREILGSHADTAFSLGNLGTSYAENGQFAEAISPLAEAVELYESLGMAELPITESYRRNLEVCSYTLILEEDDDEENEENTH